MTVQLVCEGKCNDGRVAVYDAAVKAAGRIPAGPPAGEDTKSTSGLSRVWHQLGRDLIHTEHRALPVATLFCCETCATVRTYGDVA